MNQPQNRNIATDHCAAGVARFIRFRADAMQHIEAAIAADHSFTLPRLIKAWMLHGGRDANAAPSISALMTEAEQRLNSTNCREFELLSALRLTRAGKGRECATKLDAMLLEAPTDILVHQLFHEESFWMGRADWMRNITERAAAEWRETAADYGPFLSLRAFANEESGYLDDAEYFGRMAVEMDPCDIWGAHAVAHVFFMRGENQRGISWLENLSQNWNDANQMRHHLWWHLCLFLFERNQHDRILELLSTQIRDPRSPLIKSAPAAPIDLQNFASLLFRLELYGVDVGNHWDELASICANRVHNHDNAFGNTHDIMVLTATGQFDKADALLTSMLDHYHARSGSVALAYNTVAIPTAKAILAYRQKNYAGVLNLLEPVRQNFYLLGASHAQRDVFYQLLVHAADAVGNSGLRAVYLKEIEQIGFFDVPKRAAYRKKPH